MCFPFFHGFWGGGFWIFPLFGLVIMTIFLLVFLRVLTGRDRWGGSFWRPMHGGWGGEAESPADIARRRYARGEMSKVAEPQPKPEREVLGIGS